MLKNMTCKLLSSLLNIINNTWLSCTSNYTGKIVRKVIKIKKALKWTFVACQTHILFRLSSSNSYWKSLQIEAVTVNWKKVFRKLKRVFKRRFGDQMPKNRKLSSQTLKLKQVLRQTELTQGTLEHNTGRVTSVAWMEQTSQNLNFQLLKLKGTRSTDTFLFQELCLKTIQQRWVQWTIRDNPPEWGKNNHTNQDSSWIQPTWLQTWKLLLPSTNKILTSCARTNQSLVRLPNLKKLPLQQMNR